MLPFVLGFVLGAVLAGVIGYVYVQRELRGLRADAARLRARLRTLVRLAAAGLLHPESIEAANVLNDLHEMVLVNDAILADDFPEPPMENVEVRTRERPSIRRETLPEDRFDEPADGSLPSIFRRDT